MKITFITTVLNEEKNIDLLLKSITFQTKKPDEIIIVDGGSEDNTLEKINNWVSKIRSENFRERVKVLTKKGNRAVGRNEAIRRAKSEIIVCSDSGCILDKNWIKNITKPFFNPDVNVVVGYYKGISKTIFEKSLIPYVLVMPDKVNPDKFLPAGRSMAFTKSIWEKAGGFPIRFSNNEDFVFAKKLKEIGARIVFRKNAYVYFLPRQNLFEAFVMFFKFAKGDSESGTLRPKVSLIFIRYVLFLWFLIYYFLFKLFFILEVVLYILILYIAWAVWKNYKHVRDREAILYLPLIQLTSDIAIILGTTLGFLSTIWATQKKR